jgi:hypothetical protein
VRGAFADAIGGQPSILPTARSRGGPEISIRGKGSTIFATKFLLQFEQA